MHSWARMDDLAAGDAYRRNGNLVLDVRSTEEYRRGHVPGSMNAPVEEVESEPHRLTDALRSFDKVYVHCSSGQRAQRAVAALAGTGLTNLVHVDGSGMPDWVRSRRPVEREISLGRDLLTGLVAGLVADVAVALSDKLLSQLVSEEQKREEQAVREGSPHDVAGAKIGERVTGRELSEGEKRKAQMAFTLGYGMAFGAVYSLVRRREPLATSYLGLPFAVPFFFACDGLLAPMFHMTPGLQQIPWQFNAKEMTNHIVWTATAELVHRGAERYV